MSDSGIAVQSEDDQVAEEQRVHATDEPLPPIPDGGLATSMPTWLKQAPGRPVEGEAPVTVDVASLAGSLELPPWLTKLSERLDATQKAANPIVEAPVVEPPAATDDAAVVEPAVAETDTAEAGRPLGASVIAAQQHAADRANRPARTQPPVPAAAPVDAEEFLRGGEITVSPEPRSRLPFVIAAVIIVLLAAAVVWYLGS